MSVAVGVDVVVVVVVVGVVLAIIIAIVVAPVEVLMVIVTDMVVVIDIVVALVIAVVVVVVGVVGVVSPPSSSGSYFHSIERNVKYLSTTFGQVDGSLLNLIITCFHHQTTKVGRNRRQLD